MLSKTVIWFSYNKDSELLKESVKSVIHSMPDAHLVVCDDGNNPITNDTKSFLEKNNVRYKQTFYPRNGNLIGGENLIGQVQEIYEVSKDCDVVIKLDCDTMIFKSDWVDALENHPQAVIAGIFSILCVYHYGPCYALRSSIVPLLLENITSDPPSDGCFEDCEIGARLAQLCNLNQEHTLKYKKKKEEGFWICDPIQIKENEDYSHMQIISCGNGWGSIKESNRNSYKKNQAEKMKILNEKFSTPEIWT